MTPQQYKQQIYTRNTTDGNERRSGNIERRRIMNPRRHARPRPMPAFQQDLRDILKIVPLSGFEEVGRNMMYIEWNRNIIIIDMGLRFPEEDTPGIDYIIPNISSLRGREKDILGVFITHGHLDHMGAIPYLIGSLGNPPVFTTPLTRGMILRRQEEFPRAPKLEAHTIRKDERKPIHLGPFTVENFHVNHNIPDSIGLSIATPLGTIVHSCDFKFDFSPVGDTPADIGRMAEIGSRGVLALLSDSTGAEHPGHSLSEAVIMDNLEEIFDKANGRIIAATFSSLIGRIQQIFILAEKHGRKVALDGFSMKTNVEIAQNLGYIKIPRGMMISPNEAQKLPPQKVVLMCTGAQGEEGAVLMRIANREHRFLSIKKDDSVIFSSSIVPGNERQVQYLIDSLMRQGAEVYHYRMMDIHASGHAYQEDLKLLLNIMKPKFFIPIHGQFSMLKAHANIAASAGVKEENIVVASNGNVIELTKERISIAKNSIPAQYVFVDGLGIGDVKDVVLRDRQAMAKDGMFIVVAVIDTRARKIKGEPDIISRGFVYARESEDIIKEAKHRINTIVENTAREPVVNWPYVRDTIRERLGEFFYQKTKRRPMIIPIIIEV